MTNQILKHVLIGLFIGATLYYLPFFFFGKVIFFFLAMVFVFNFFRRRRYYGPFGWNYADKIRSMSDDEYSEFKEKAGHGCGYSNQTENKKA